MGIAGIAMDGGSVEVSQRPEASFVGTLKPPKRVAPSSPGGVEGATGGGGGLEETCQSGMLSGAFGSEVTPRRTSSTTTSSGSTSLRARRRARARADQSECAQANGWEPYVCENANGGMQRTAVGFLPKEALR